MRTTSARGKRRAATYPLLSRLAPTAFHDVANLAHPAAISVSHALAVGATVAVGEEAVARGLKLPQLRRRRGRQRSAILSRHTLVQRREPAVGADRDLAAG